MRYKVLMALILGLSANLHPIMAQGTAGARDLVVHVFGVHDGDTLTLPGANVWWLGTTQGAASDASGLAALPAPAEVPDRFAVSYIGYHNDTVDVYHASRRHYYVFLVSEAMLDAVEIVRKRRSQFISVVNPVKTEIIGEGELKRAACCDLSESFETNASVDVSYSDAVTGAKEIRLLGLDGVYVEMLQENVPALRGLAVPFGLAYVPGPWISNIYISKGAGTVRYGHESMTGSINYELRKPLETDPLYLDLFANHMGRYEVNVVTGANLSETEGFVLAVNAGGQHKKLDGNDDGFLDQPLYDRFNVMNRWRFLGDRANAQFYVNYLRDDRLSGQVGFDPEVHKGGNSVYGLGLTTNRFDGYGKTGFFFDGKPYQNIGLTYNFTWHDQRGYFGQRDYSGTEISGNASLFFQTILGTTDHGFLAGVHTYGYRYHENFDGLAAGQAAWNTGVFAEYTYKLPGKLDVVAGFRMDHHGEYGVQFSPRLHVKWQTCPVSALRFSVGRGFRAARLLGEQVSYMASSRDFSVTGDPGLEAAWNTGVSYHREFTFGQRSAFLSADYYFTWFTRQVVADADGGDNRLLLYELDGRSFANSGQIEAGMELAKGLDLRLAYKIDDVRTTLRSGTLAKALIPLHKGLLVVGYLSPKETWQADLIVNLHGRHRLPESFGNGDAHRYSPVFAMLNLQVSRFFPKGIELYVGAENLTNFKQDNVVIGASDPFGDRFDTAQVWGPVMGAVFYGGFRWFLRSDE